MTAFTADNTIERLLSIKYEPVQNKYDKCGIYQLTCPAFNMIYTGQTGRPFKTRFQEHLRDLKYGSNKSKFTQHLLDNRHATGPMNSIMETVYMTDKGKMTDTIERYCIFRETENNNQINDKLTVKPNAVFDVTVHEDPYSGRTNPSQPDDTLVSSVVRGRSLLLHRQILPAEDQSPPHIKPATCRP